ncbi:hypothetical protein Q3A66_02055 [Hymenobacter sp. BT770]|uniref:hypothetical protein n=1 Tax=Hymenobacter sp. BT770 TaxID=2886942 RepID=UPI001D0FDD43|nr:hypothetical protein [Hymenobacter sp. BT770]MCC3151588.1 hypothetical protein [Hymenobacter sp. BT770]MDO3413835.1 hypothetical protein [Hymenobacter sp. BT770]
MIILASIAALMATNINHPFVERADELQKQLITTSGIFTALMFAILMPKFSERGIERKQLIQEYRNDCKQLAAFRSFMHFTLHFGMFSEPIVSMLRNKFLKGRSFNDYRSSLEIEEELNDLINSEKVKPQDSGKMHLYAAIRDFAYEASAGGISFYRKHSEYTFSLEKLQYLQECCGAIWYSFDKYKYLSEPFNYNYNEQHDYWNKRMEELIPSFSLEEKAPKDKAKFVMNQAGIYEQFIGAMINKMDKILYTLSPNTFSSISFDTIFILAFGVVIPLYTLLFETSPLTSQIIGFTCFSITITFIINFVFDLYLFFNKDWFKDKYEEEIYPLYPEDRY